MRVRDLSDLVLLAALWGGSFLFMRYAAPAFGPLPLIWLRVAVAALCLTPLLIVRGQQAVLRRHAADIAIMAVFSSALPFVLIAWAMLSITAGLASILNATVPIFTALIGAVWLRERLGAWRTAGLVVGFGGVLLLAADKADFKPGGSGWAIAAMLLATFSYGFAANLTRRRLTGVPPLVNAAGSQIASALVLLPFAVWFWSATTPGGMAWSAAIALGVGCTALAFLLFWPKKEFNKDLRILPEWIQKILIKHATDKRDYLYTRKELEAAKTHDPLWNAAQKELIITGRMHNYMRMLWGKKVIEWSKTYKEAFDTLEEFNNKYAYDGKNPNSYTGILWCFGLFDRPWFPERNVHGNLRYMSSDSTKKKFRMMEYLEYAAKLEGKKESLF
jgi:drug/metabolite transporter (DMT)-like permease